MSAQKKEQVLQYFIKAKKELEERVASFRAWSNTNVKFEADVKKILRRNKQIVSLKWTQRGVMSKLQNARKKRTGKKQKRMILENK